VKIGLLEEGIKFHGVSSNQANGLPSAIAWIGKSDRLTLPARYPLKTYEYRTGDHEVQAKTDTAAYMYEGVMHTIEVRFKMNTPGVANGEREMWIDDQRVLLNTNVNYRNNSGELFAQTATQIYAGGVGRPLAPIHVWSGPLLLHPTTRPGMLRTV
jgi:hypothetical protein